MKKEHIISVDKERCVKCEMCKKDCTMQIIRIGEKSSEITTQECIKCGHCVAICPKQAISMSGYEDGPEDIVPDMKLDPEVLLAKMKSRRSMRYFTAQDVAPEDIEKIIEAGRFSPTAKNMQGLSYVVLKDNIDEYERIAVTMLRRIKPVATLFTSRYKGFDIVDNFFFKGAPVAIVIKANDVLDGALAASLMELMAQTLGLGVLYSGFFTFAANKSGKLKRKLSLNRGDKVVTTLVLGHPDVQYKRTAQRESAQVIYD